MCRRVCELAVVFGIAFLALGQAARGRDWIDDLDQGKNLAAKEGKDLIIIFTGGLWCGDCVVFKHKVLDQPDFAPVCDSFVLVVLEFPATSDELPANQRDKYLAWQTQYGIHSFPTVLFADAGGKPYSLCGYSQDVGPKECLRQFRQLQDVRRQRDAALADAAASHGIERAKHLDEALSAMHKALSAETIDQQGNPLVRFYRAEIDELLAILALDTKNEAGLRDKYSKKLAAEAERKQITDTIRRIQAIGRKEGFDKAVQLVDQELQRPQSAESRKRLQNARLTYLEWDDRFDDALAYINERLKDPTLSPDERLSLRGRVAYNLEKLNRIDEAAAVYDDLIVQAAGNDRKVWSLHQSKAEMLRIANRSRESLETWTLARKYVHKGSDDWLTTELVGRIWNLIRLERFAEAEAVHEEIAKSGTVTPLELANALVFEAFRYKEVGHRQEALAKVRAAEKLLADIKPDRLDQAVFDRIRDGIKAIIDETNAADEKIEHP